MTNCQTIYYDTVAGYEKFRDHLTASLADPTKVHPGTWVQTTLTTSKSGAVRFYYMAQHCRKRLHDSIENMQTRERAKPTRRAASPTDLQARRWDCVCLLQQFARSTHNRLAMSTVDFDDMASNAVCWGYDSEFMHAVRREAED